MGQVLGMTETLTVINARVDDRPLLLAQLERMDAPEEHIHEGTV